MKLEYTIIDDLISSLLILLGEYKRRTTNFVLSNYSNLLDHVLIVIDFLHQNDNIDWRHFGVLCLGWFYTEINKYKRGVLLDGKW